MAESPAGWLPRAAIAALSVVIAAQVAHSSWRLWTLARMPATRVSAAPLVTVPRQVAVSTLVAAHLFGKAPDAAAPEAPAAAAAQWVLTGTLQGDSPSKGSAILGSTATTTRFCAAGQEVAGGFRLSEVFADSVTLERAGERISLRLPRESHAVLPGQLTRVAGAAAAHMQLPLEERVRKRPQNQTEALLELRPALHRGVDRFDGMRVLGTGDGSNLRTYGLQRNDIIREVDGHPIDNGTAQYRALDTLSRGHPVTVTVERGGNVFTLQLGFSNPGS